MTPSPPLPFARCAALYRVSTARQAQPHDPDEESLPLQRLAVRRFVEARPGWQLVAEFSEEGVSAYHHSSADRDILQDVLAQARRGTFDVLLVFKADRLSRQAMEYPFILATLHQAGVRVFSVADDPGGRELAADSQYDKLLRFLEGWQAETESVNTSIRVGTRMRQLAEQGRWTGGKAPYGYRYDPAATPVPLAIEPAEAAWLQRAFTLYLEHGLGTPRIAALLNAEGVRQRNGRPLTDMQLRRAMQNPVVTGRLPYGRTYRSPQHRRRQRGAHDLTGVILSPVIPALVIVPQATWEAAMDRMAHYNARRDRHWPRHSRANTGPLLLTGFARCAHCGGTLVGTRVTTKKWHKGIGGYKKYWTPAYLCQTKATRGTALCDGQRTYSARRVETAVLNAVRQTLETLDHAELLAEVRRQYHARQGDLQRRRAAADHAVAEAERLYQAWLERLDQWLLHPEASPYSEAVLADRLRAAEARLAEARQARAALAADAQAIATQDAALTRFLGTVPDWWRHFLAAPRARQKALLQLLLDRVEVGRAGLTLHYRLNLAALTDQADAAALTWTAQAGW